MDEEEVKNTQQTQQSGNVVDKVAQTAQKGKKMVDNVKKAKQAANAAKTLSMSGPLMYILFWVFVVIVAIIIITGIVMFLVTMPGMVMEKLKAIFKEIGNYIAAFYGADTTAQIDDVQIYETLDYLEDMGWDIKTEGFLTGYYEDGDSVGDKLSDAEKEAGYDIDEETGVVRAEGGKIILADSDFIFTYIMSDNYVYTLKNKNLATQESADNWFKKIGTAIATSWYKVKNFFYGPLFDALGVTDGMVSEYGKGLIGIYYDTAVGVQGNAVNEDSFWNWDAIDIDPETKKLAIKRRSFMNNNNALEFSLDGWTGRYGMPLEFLLSVHKATMMPDLAYDMATSFPTEIHLLLHETSGEAIAGYRTVDGNYIKWPAIQEAIAGFEGRNWLTSWFADVSAWLQGDGVRVQAAKQCGVDVGTGESPCTCTFKEGIGDKDGHQLEEHINIPGVDDNTWHYTADYSYTDEQGNEVVHHTKDQEYTGKRQKIKIVENACTACAETVDGIWQYLRDNHDYNFKAYTPYISEVSDHWYRDVHFVVSKGSNLEFVDYDYDYEAVMKERWTLYETYPDDESDPIYGTTTDAEYKSGKVGEFIIYLIDEDGNYKKDSSNRYMIYDGSFDEARGNTLYIKNDKDEYVMYTGVIGEDGEAKDKDGNTIALYRKVTDEQFAPYDKNETIAVAKKAVTIDSSDTDALKDVGWIKNSSSVWSAYKVEDTTSGFEQLFTEEEVANEKNTYYQTVMKNCFINLDMQENLVQVGEGQRAETNPLIKKMFLQNKYFRYDGSKETAEIITALREQKPDDDSDDIKYGALDETELAKTVKIDEKTYTVKDYAGVVTLNQDSLNAFSMLENTHTLDADYIYRDFKELIVELGYFEKEELTDETPKIIQFIVPEIGSAEYPNRTIDKRENEFGTMVHSKHDIDANKKYTLKAIVESLGEESDTSNPTDTSTGGGGGGSNSFVNPSNSRLTSVTSRVNNERLQLNYNPVRIAEVGAIGSTKRPEQVSVDEFLKKTREMCEYINKVGYDYCVIRNTPGEDGCTECLKHDGCKAERAEYGTQWVCNAADGPGEDHCEVNHCKHSIHGNSCGLPTTFEDSKQTGKTNFCCATLVSWALQNVGIMPMDTVRHGADGDGGVEGYCLNELKGEWIEIGEQLKPGDILVYDGHVDICGEKKDGGFVRYNGGHQVRIGAVEGESSKVREGGSSIEKPFADWSSLGDKIRGAIRLNWGNQNDGPYEGYIGNEAVVSPVSGILLDYGTYGTKPENTTDSVSGEEYRVNVDLRYGPSIAINEDSNTQGQAGQGQQNQSSTVEHENRIFSDKVGYARILVLNKEIFEMMDSTVSHKWRTNNGGQGLLSDNGIFAELVTTEDDLEALTDESSGDFLSETVYGYKEFAEMYEKYGIAGYVVYIDGFKCELPDDTFVDSDDDGELSDESGNPDGKDLKFDDFKISKEDVKARKESELVQTKYEMPGIYKVASEKATIKLNVEETIKNDTYFAMAIDNPKTYEPLKELDKLVFIKEGTVLGRTYTDKELVEQRLADGDDPKYDYKYYKPDETTSSTTDEDKEKNEDKLIGNYVRVIMTDENKEAIEDVETYMKLDELEMHRPQPYIAQEGDDILLANMMHREGCTNGFQGAAYGSHSKEEADELNMATGYVLINRALVNYGNHGTTIKEQLNAPGQYSTADEVAADGSTIKCMDCYANAELCLQWDCMYVTNPNGVQMTRDVLGQSGWCFCTSGGSELDPGKECFWWADGNKDGIADEHYEGCSRYDEFFCYIEKYKKHRND